MGYNMKGVYYSWRTNVNIIWSTEMVHLWVVDLTFQANCKDTVPDQVLAGIKLYALKWIRSTLLEASCHWTVATPWAPFRERSLRSIKVNSPSHSNGLIEMESSSMCQKSPYGKHKVEHANAYTSCMFWGQSIHINFHANFVKDLVILLPLCTIRPNSSIN